MLRVAVVLTLVLTALACKSNSEGTVKDANDFGPPPVSDFGGEPGGGGNGLDAKLRNVACVSFVEAEGVASIGQPGDAPPPASGNWAVGVKPGVAPKACANQIKAALPGVKIVNILSQSQLIYVAGDAPQGGGGNVGGGGESNGLDEQLRAVACVSLVEAEGVASIGQPGDAPPPASGNWAVGVKDGVTPKNCVKQIKAKIPAVQVLQTLDQSQLIYVKG